MSCQRKDEATGTDALGGHACVLAQSTEKGSRARLTMRGPMEEVTITQAAGQSPTLLLVAVHPEASPARS
jgi:hypothetical protein